MNCMDMEFTDFKVWYQGTPYRVYGSPSNVFGRLVYRADNLLNGFQTVLHASFVWEVAQQ